MKQEECYCQYCGKLCKNKMSKVRHEYFCELNPDYQQHIENHKNTTVKTSKSDKTLMKISNFQKLRREKFLQEHPEEVVQEYEFVCEKCGKHFFRKMKVKHYLAKYRLPRFCCNSCANAHNCTEAQARKIGESVKKEHEHICPKCGKHFLHNGTCTKTTLCYECRGRQTTSYYPINAVKVGEHLFQMEFNLQYPIQCTVCGKQFFQKKLETTCSKECYSKLVSRNSKEQYKKVVQEGRFKGWKPRTQESYPEKYWKEVLTNLGISFEREVRCIPGYLYSLDFIIQLKNGLKVDLEIDGKQHWYDDRRQYDEKRNKIVRSNGFLVYRIDWNNLNSKRGKMKMHAKINQFVWWFNKVNI